jgi:GTP:adenosylcobinamide-phosphate guanylyltransferase
MERMQLSYTALVLAGKRDAPNPVAASAGLSHKTLVTILGVSMLERVVMSLRQANRIGAIIVAIEDPRVLEAVPRLQALIASGELLTVVSTASVAGSVLCAFDLHRDRLPFLVVSADQPLLRPEIVDAFCAGVDAASDVGLGFVPERCVRAAYPHTKRTFLRFADGGFKNCNLYAFHTLASARACVFWERVEQLRKRPLRVASAFGWRFLLAYVLRREDLRGMMTRAGGVLGVTLSSVILEFADAAVDVDSLDDLELATRVLAAGQGS